MINRPKDGLFVDKTGNKFYYKDGVLHRANDLPAIEWTNGDRSYWKYGHLHRIMGPAIAYLYDYKEWWFEGKKINCTTQEEFEQLMRLKAFW